MLRKLKKWILATVVYHNYKVKVTEFGSDSNIYGYSSYSKALAAYGKELTNPNLSTVMVAGNNRFTGELVCFKLFSRTPRYSCE